MAETDSAAVSMARSSDVEAKEMSAVSDPYIREQLEKRRKELNAVIASPAAAAPAASLLALCLDHLTSDEQRALERDLELAARVQRGLLPRTDLRHGDWLVHYQYKPAGMVSGDYCDLIPPAEADGELVFLLGDVAGKGVAA